MALSTAQRREAASDRAADRAAQRVSFQLVYERATEPRRHGVDGITGPSIADAFKPGDRSPGEWCGDRSHEIHDEAGWIEVFAEYALKEAIHEGLEWFQVDGRPWLNPHGEHEDVIYQLTGEFVAKLAALRNGKA